MQSPGMGLGTPVSSAPPPSWRSTPGIPSFGTPSGQNNTPASQKPKKPGSEGRYIVYYDEDDVEIHRFRPTPLPSLHGVDSHTRGFQAEGRGGCR